MKIADDADRRLRVLGASVASERRVVMAVLRGYRQALACAQPA